jgi:beta-glucanase (GH16 family)
MTRFGWAAGVFGLGFFVLGCGGDDSTAASADGGAPDGSVSADAGGDAAVSDAAAADAPHDVATDAPAWKLVWSDEFNGANGSAPDPTKWNHETGGGGWGNSELEYYTADLANSSQENGNLVITATTAGAAQHQCWNGTCQYTSARLITKGLFTQAYGRFEARIRIPKGQGLWPAFWMLGSNIDTVQWPTCGEIDIMENVGREPSVNHGSLHGPGYSGGNPLTGTYTLPGGRALGDDFHVYAAEWETNVVRFYVDTTLYETRTPADVPMGARWVYDHPFFLLLNIAIGGQFPGSPDNTTSFPQQMLVDYVRVYARP